MIKLSKYCFNKTLLPCAGNFLSRILYLRDEKSLSNQFHTDSTNYNDSTNSIYCGMYDTGGGSMLVGGLVSSLHIGKRIAPSMQQ